MPILTKAAQPSQGQRLPNELLLHTIRFLRPTGSEILPSSHETTKILLALMLVCRTANEAASTIFARHCIHLDSEDRTLRFANCLSLVDSHLMSGHSPPFAGITAIMLESFMEYTEELEGHLAVVKLDDSRMASDSDHDDDIADRSGESDHGGEEKNDEQDPREDVPNHDKDEDEDEDEDEDDYLLFRPHPEINDLPVATAVHDIFIAVAPTLQRLIINIPLRSLYPENDEFGVKTILRRGFKSLVNLEEFVSIKDELFVTTDPHRDIPEDDVWATCWPKIRRLYLYNPMIDEIFWDNVKRCPQLSRIMLGRPDGNHHIEPGPGDIKRGWITALAGHNATTNVYDGGIRPLTYVNVDMTGIQPSVLGFRHDWRTLDPEECIRVRLADIPPEAWIVDLGIRDGAELCPKDTVRIWVRKHALAGTLWDEDAIGAYDPLAGIE